jgi:hypothetical protein
MGYGWWCWIIPLKGGDVSIGLVYDSRLFQPPPGATIGERLQAHFQTHPVGRELLGEAVPVAGDQRAFSMLPYYSERVAGDGWIMAGDAAGFIDPLYSPGRDFCGFTASAAAALIRRAVVGEGKDGSDGTDGMTAAIEDYNRRYAFCFRSWFDGIYRDKYYYLGDAELMAAAFLLDISSYHLGPVRQVFDNPMDFEKLPFDGVPGRIVAKILRFQNARLVALARKRQAAGVYGKRNAGWRLLVGGFVPDASVLKLLFKGVRLWLRAEWGALWLRRKHGAADVIAEQVAEVSVV